MGGVYLLLGSNLGDRMKNLSDARHSIGSVVRSSAVYATAAWGNTFQPDFLNQAVEIDGDRAPGDLLKRIAEIESSMGRQRIEKWGPRIIDIDIALYHDHVIHTNDLIVPHPEIQNRRFALEPLCELSPDMVHPVLMKTIRQLLEECKDPLPVTRLPHQH